MFGTKANSPDYVTHNPSFAKSFKDRRTNSTVIKMQVEQIVRRTFVIPPWTRYRSILTKIAKYLNVNKGVWDAFKVFFYQSISGSSREVEVSTWLKRMEQEVIVSIDNLDVLIMFFEHNDECMDIEILRSLREFNLWRETVHFLLLGLPKGT